MITDINRRSCARAGAVLRAAVRGLHGGDGPDGRLPPRRRARPRPAPPGPAAAQFYNLVLKPCLIF